MAILRQPAFARAEYERRLDRVRIEMTRRNLDALILVGPHNINYLSGMDTENLFDFQSLIIPLSGDPKLVILDFELGRAEASTWLDAPVAYSSFEDPVSVTKRAVEEAGLGRGHLGLEQRSTVVSSANVARLTDELSDAVIEDPFGVVESVRLVKSDAEIEYMRRAAALTDAAVLAGYSQMRVGAADHANIA